MKVLHHRSEAKSGKYTYSPETAGVINRLRDDTQLNVSQVSEVKELPKCYHEGSTREVNASCEPRVLPTLAVPGDALLSQEEEKDIKKCFLEHVGVVAHFCGVPTVLKDKLNISLL